MSKLHSILLDKFKGASNSVAVDFDRDKDITVIFGENGTGKSAISDAFDFVCNGSIGSLEDKSVGSPKGKYIPTMNSEQKDCKVVLKYDSKEWIGTFGPRFVPSVSGVKPNPIAKVLRREKIQEFIIKQPNQRYDAIKSFINTPYCDKFEQSVNQLRIRKEREYNEATNSLTMAHQALEKHWIAEGKPGSNYIEWAKGEAKEGKVTLEASKKSYQEIATIIQNLFNAKTSLGRSETDLESARSKYTEKEKDFKKASAEASDTMGDLIKLLKNAKTYVTKRPTDETCPVCEQSIVPSSLLKKLDERLSSLDSFVKAQEELELSKKALDTQEAINKRALISFLESCIKGVISFKIDTHTEIVSLDIDWGNYSKLNSLENKTDITLLENAVEFYNKVFSLKEAISIRIDDFTKKINLLSAISSNLETINEKETGAKNLERIVSSINKLYSIVIKSRNEFVENVLNSISSDVDQMYEKIHPGESIGCIKLVTSKTASLDLTAKFQTEDDILPQAYYSESHLDTLGICLFIALAKFYKTDDTILVLDDVITSADQVHLSRFIRMLEGELSNFSHTIITTHYQVWRDKYRFGGGNVQLIELLSWSIARGVRHTKTKLYIDELYDYVKAEPMDKQIVASKAGIFLELMLDNLALMYGCKLPRKYDPFYTLGEFLNAFSSSLKKRMKVEIVQEGQETITLPLIELFNVLPEDSLLRNEVGCHFNITGQNYSEGDIKNMAENTLKLAEALICDGCGELPYKSKSGSYYECKCGKKHLYPLEN